MSQALNIIYKLRKDIDKLQDGIVNFLADNIERGARRNFKSFIPYASTDFPFINVSSTQLSVSGTSSSRTVQCRGNQVLFIEFGVGAMNKETITPEWTSVSYTINESGNYDLRIRKGGGYDRPLRGFRFENNQLVEFMPRPLGIVNLGGYGKHLGQNDYWIRPSIDGVPRAEGEMPVTVHGDPSRTRTDVVWTTGHQPARALYRAIRSSMKSLEKKLSGGI